MVRGHHDIDRVTKLDDTQRALVETARKFARAEIEPIATAADRDNSAPIRELINKMGALGLHGVTVKQEDGGLGLGFLEHCLIMEEVSRASASVGLAYGAHSNLCINQIAKRGNAEQKARFLPGLISGQSVGALAMTEPDAGSDVFSMRTRAERSGSGDSYRINGTKTFITNGGTADLYVVYARTRPDDDDGGGGSKKKHEGLSCFVVEKGTRGFTFGPKFDKLGMRGSDTCQLTFEDCVVPAKNMLGKENEGGRILLSGLDSERLVLSAGPLGIMAACIDAVVPYVSQRQQFGKKIGAFQMIQAKLAEMHVALSASRAFVHAVARAVDSGVVSSADTAAAIMFSSEQATRVALEAVQALGGYGYTNDYPVARHLRDAKLYEIGAGTAEIRRVIIANDLIKKSLQ